MWLNANFNNILVISLRSVLFVEEDEFPLIGKSAIVIPIPKPGKDHPEPSNNRPKYSTN